MPRIARAVKEQGAPLLGIAAYFYDPIFVEIAAKLGFRVLWIEMEHAFITFAQAADLCRIASGSGMLTMIRIPDNRRENVLKAAECGPDMIDLPMADSPEIVHDFIQHARFRPEGARGYFSVPRALDYGMVESLPQAQKPSLAPMNSVPFRELIFSWDRPICLQVSESRARRLTQKSSRQRRRAFAAPDSTEN